MLIIGGKNRSVHIKKWIIIAKILILFKLFSIYIQKSDFSLPHPSSLLSLTSFFPSLSLSILPFFFVFYKKWNHTIEFSVFLFCIVISSDCIGIQKICIERSETPHHFFFILLNSSWKLISYQHMKNLIHSFWWPHAVLLHECDKMHWY